MALPFRPQPAEGNFAVRVIVGDCAGCARPGALELKMRVA